VSKEKTSYEREVVSNENKLEKMMQEGKDEYEIKKQVGVLYHINIFRSILLLLLASHCSKLMSNSVLGDIYLASPHIPHPSPY